MHGIHTECKSFVCSDFLMVVLWSTFHGKSLLFNVDRDKFSEETKLRVRMVLIIRNAESTRCSDARSNVILHISFKTELAKNIY